MLVSSCLEWSCSYMPSCSPCLIPSITNSSKRFCVSNATEQESGARTLQHRSIEFVGHSVGFGTITAHACPVSSPLSPILSPLLLSSENWKGFRKIGDDSYLLIVEHLCSVCVVCRRVRSRFTRVPDGHQSSVFPVLPR